MTKNKPLQILWLKRDLRTYDHAPACRAIEKAVDTGGLLVCYIFEPSVMAHYDSDVRHWRFALQSLENMNSRLRDFGVQIQYFYGEALEIFENLAQNFNIQHVFSYQEIGNNLTFERDKQLKIFFKKQKIAWKETPMSGIRRGLSHRKTWKDDWFAMAKSKIQNPDWSFIQKYQIECPPPVSAFQIDQNSDFFKEISTILPHFQAGGEAMGWRYLRSFVAERGKNYMAQISKPESSRRSCGRVSPYLAFGCLSSRQVFQFVEQHRQQIGLRNADEFLEPLALARPFYAKI